MPSDTMMPVILPSDLHSDPGHGDQPGCSREPLHEPGQGDEASVYRWYTKEENAYVNEVYGASDVTLEVDVEGGVGDIDLKVV
jgi:hypothetical protein